MRNGFSKLSRTLSRSRPYSALILAAFLLYPQAINANGSGSAVTGSGPVSPQVFTRGSFVYVVDHQRVVFLSMDTRSSHTLYNSVDSVFNIVSAARSGDVIWASNAMGAVIAVNMQTGTVEEFGRGRVAGGGRIGVDRRFVWLASGDTLYRMDLTSREWVSLPVPKGGGEVRGLISFNDQVHIISESAVHVFTTASEDWVVVPHNDFVLAAGDFRRVGDAAYITQERGLYRYDPAKRLISGWRVRERLRAASLTPDNLVVATENRVYRFDTHSLALEPQPALPMLRGVRAVAMHNGSVVCVTGGGLAMNAASPFGFGIVTYPDYVNAGEDVFAFSLDGHIILYMGGRFVLYHHDRRLWSGVPVVSRGGERRDQYRWDENGAYINFTDDHQATVFGGGTARVQPNANYTEEGGLEADPGAPLANVTLNLHTEDPAGRFLDIAVDNGVSTLPPQKGFYYRGIEGDLLDRASYGVQGSGLAVGQVTPDVITEGGSAVFSGKARTENRDRPFSTATAGSGYVLSKTEWHRFDYNPSGVYPVEGVGAAREIVPSSVRMYVDGIPLAGADFIYDPAANAVRLLRRDKSDPTSVIQISFAERALPNEKAAFEPLPENHFGRYSFVEGALSPRSWLSARAGVLEFEERGPGFESGPMLLAGVPVELRGGANRSFLLHPEIAYDTRIGTHSAGVSAGVRENRAFGSYRGFWTEQDFYGIDWNRNSFSYQNINAEHELNVGYDLRDDLRASWYQLHRNAGGIDLSHFELRSSYTGNLLPDIEASLSSRFVEEGGSDSRKETFSLRVSDLSSRYLSELNGLHNVGYDLAWTEYRDTREKQGRVVYGALNVSPVAALTLSGSGMYRLNPSDFRVREEINPSLSVYMRDLPRGFDIASSYSVYVSELAEGGSNVGMGRNLSGYFYPGEYAKALESFAVYLGYANGTESHAPPIASPLKYALFTDSNTYLISTSVEAGLLCFPMENLLMSGLVSRYNETNAEMTYGSYERLKMWFERGGGFEVNFNSAKNPSRLYLHADALYEHRFQNGVLGGAGLFGTRDSKNYSVSLNGGPQFQMSLTKDLSGSFRSVENSHRLLVAVNSEETSKPDLEYSLYLRLGMRPDISLVAELNAALRKMRSGSGSGGLFLHAGF